MIKVGLIGCGFMGTMHANCYKAIEGVTVTAVADIRKDKAEALAGLSDAKIFNSGFDLIENADVDIIDICLPTFLHTEHALKAMEKVKYLFIEKPVALTETEGNLLIEKQRETGCEIQIGQVIRFWDEYVYLKEIFDNKKYGGVINANFRRISPRPMWGWNNWLLDNDLSGGAAQDLHIHDSDFMLYLFGCPEKTMTVKNKIGEKNSYINTICKYKDFVASVEGTWDLPSTYPFEMYYRVVFEKAVLELNGGKLTIYSDNEKFEPQILKIENKADFKGGNVSDLGGYYNELLYFTNKAKNKNKIKKATLSDGVNSLHFVLKEIENA